MKLQRIIIQFSIILLLPIFSCEKTIIEQVNGGVPGEGKTYSIEGYAQKGPFIVGTDVTVSELNNELFPTGRVFFATILDDKGYFELPGVVLESQYIQIKVRGRYFSETGGYVPTEELTLYSLADITESETINVNILTHLEKERVEYLVQEKEFSFEDAKEKAQAEILAVFEWQDQSVGNSEDLDLNENNIGGGILLAISSIFENIDFIKRVETITNFKVDLSGDGILNSEPIQNRLLTSAGMLNTKGVRTNMETKYQIEMPDFEGPIKTFVETSSYTNYFDLIFPTTTDGKINLLRFEGSTLNSSDTYAIIVQSAPPNLEYGVAGKNFYYFCFFPDNPPSSFNIDSDLWLQSVNDDIECQNLDFCNRKIYSMSEIGTVDYSIPVVRSGIGKLEFNLSIDIDGIFKSEYKEITW